MYSYYTVEHHFGWVYTYRVLPRNGYVRRPHARDTQGPNVSKGGDWPKSVRSVVEAGSSLRHYISRRYNQTEGILLCFPIYSGLPRVF
jgi:hypothetical protein